MYLRRSCAILLTKECDVSGAEAIRGVRMEAVTLGMHAGECVIVCIEELEVLCVAYTKTPPTVTTTANLTKVERREVLEEA